MKDSVNSIGQMAAGAISRPTLMIVRGRIASPNDESSESKEKAFRRLAFLVAILTGHGLKDPDSGVETAKKYETKREQIPADYGEVMKALGF